MRLEIKIEDEAAFVGLLKKVDAKDSVDLINEALSLLSWFCEQEAAGRSVASISGGKVCHTLSVCECCDELIIGTDLHHVAALYEQHLLKSPACKAWHDKQRVENEQELQRLREKFKDLPPCEPEDDDEIICPHCGGVIE